MVMVGIDVTLKNLLDFEPSQSVVKMPTGKDIRAKNERVSINNSP